MTSATDTTTRVRERATPALRVRDTAAAIDFYIRAFGAKELMRFEAGGSIPHAELQIGESLIYLGEAAPEYGFPGPEQLGGSPVVIQLQVEDVDATVARAAAAGARVVSPPADQFYGDRTARLTDPFGHRWNIVTRIEELSVEEMHRRMAAMEAQRPSATSASHRPEGYRTVTPYIVVGDAPAQIEFLVRVFDADERFRSIGSAGGVHAELRIGDSMLMVGGGAPDLNWRGVSMPSAFHVYVPDADATFDRAVQAGATVIHQVADMDYGERSGGVRDAFGNCWYIATARGPHYVPAGRQSVNVYLHPHRAEPLLAFLSRAFGAEQVDKHASPDGIVHHAVVRIGDSAIEMGEAHGPFQPMPTMFYVYVPNVDAAYMRATGAGAVSIQEPADQEYGDRTAAVKDVFGHQWYLATPLRAR